MLSAFSGAFSILLMCMVGYFLYRRGFVTGEALDFITKLVAKIAVPCMLLINAYNNFTPEFFQTTGLWLFIPLAIIIILYSLGYLVARLIGIPKGDRGVFCATFTLPNTITIGLPITIAVFGEEGIPYMMSFYIATSIFFWSFGVSRIAHDGGHYSKDWKQSVKSFFSPSVVALLAGIAIRFSPVAIPKALTIALENMGNMTTPLSLIISGCILAQMGRDAFRLRKMEAASICGRFIIAPALCLLFCSLLAVPSYPTRIYTVQSSLPSMNQIMLMSRYYGANERLGAQIMIVTTLLSVIFIPLIVLAMDLMGI